MINYKRGIKLLRSEDYPENDPVLKKLEQGYKQVRSKFNKQKIEDSTNKNRRRPASAAIRPNSARSKKNANQMSHSKISFSKNPNQSSFSKSGFFAQKRQRSGSFRPQSTKPNPSLTTFNNMQWRKSNEYTHNDDRGYFDRIHLHSEIKPRKLNAYKSENPKFEHAANSSRLNKSRNRRLFDGSKSTLKSKNNSRISAVKPNVGYKTKNDDFLYQAKDQQRDNYLRQLPKSRNKVYQLEEDEKDLLDDSWEENISDEEDNHPTHKQMRENQEMK